MWNGMFSAVELLQKGANAAWLRNEVISNNIANADTPGFKRSDVNLRVFSTASWILAALKPKRTASNPRWLAAAPKRWAGRQQRGY